MQQAKKEQHERLVTSLASYLRAAKMDDDGYVAVENLTLYYRSQVPN